MTSPAHFTIHWQDAGREPRCAPNPAHPRGIDVDASEGAAATCFAPLPYPARRCGAFLVKCDVCGQTVMITTAGRPDDPRSIKLACNAKTAVKN